MNTQQLFRLAGAAAIIGGAGRIFSAFDLLQDQTSREWLWTAIDVFLLFGWFGIYLARADKLGFLGLTSFVVGAAALSFIGGPDADVFGFSTYEQGAVTLVIATLGLSLAWLRGGEKPLWAPLLWLGAAISAGALSAVPTLAPYHFIVAGALFGAAFIAAGWDLLRR